MNTNSMKQVLSAPINLLRPANEEECGLFHNKKGWFYTFGLESGPRFVAHLTQGNEGGNLFIFRPLNNLVPHLLQFQWQEHPHSSEALPRYKATCQTTPDTSQAEREFLTDILRPTQIDIPVGHHGQLWGREVRRWYYPEMLVKAHQINEQLIENMKMKKALLEQQRYAKQMLLAGQTRLNSLMIPGDTSTGNKVQQKTIQERRKQNG